MSNTLCDCLYCRLPDFISGNRHTTSDTANGRFEILDGEETRYGETQDDRQEELRRWIDEVDTQIRRAEASLDELKKHRQHLANQLGTSQCGS